ncbi:hypothetical protein L0657_24345 [Dyadobacter sp. CY345]|uniref:hypothetical protein n=1 Tax=Dyadobacter sp. CY345 TaxID=2909335 RepID=UPI001F242BFA|nr:hypothetical protein [Dyadobacter sp. CY345]MCF2447107.1 hypothetical protein [Dyadobacter sp. CY345]
MMTSNAPLSAFYFSSSKFDFWPIYKSIKQYYPLGMSREGSLFFQYSGFDELGKIIMENIHDATDFKQRWSDFENKVGLLADKEVIGTTYGQAPSFSGYLILDSLRLPDRTLTKELFFAVSLVSKFYTVIGRDKTQINLSEITFAESTNLLIVSPEGIYQPFFEMVCLQIEKQFDSYRFVPYEIATQYLEGLHVRYTDEPADKIFNALFNKQIDLDASVIGDRYCKSSSWAIQE